MFPGNRGLFGGGAGASAFDGRRQKAEGRGVFGSGLLANLRRFSGSILPLAAGRRGKAEKRGGFRSGPRPNPPHHRPPPPPPPLLPPPSRTPPVPDQPHARAPPPRAPPHPSP